MSGSRGEANFVWKCSLCKRESSISQFTQSYIILVVILILSILLDFDNSFVREKAFYNFEDSESQKFVTLAVLECRVCEITAFDPKVSPLSHSSLNKKIDFVIGNLVL